MKLNNLVVLMWKHATVRLRRYVHTAVEIVSPLTFFIIFFSLRNQLSHPSERNNTLTDTEYIHNIIPPDETPLMPSRFILKTTPLRIFYMPQSDHTDAIMEMVGNKLLLKRLYHFPDLTDDRIRGYMPITNMTSIEDLSQKMGESDAIVQFQNMESEELPKTLNYSIRMNTNFMTHVYKPLDGSMTPHSFYGRQYEQFLQIQWSIDTSYVKLLTNNDIKQEVTLQEFPYATSLSEIPSVHIITNGLRVFCTISLLLVFVFFMAKLLEERCSGIQELIKMFGVSPTVLTVSNFLNTLPAGLVYSVGGAALTACGDNPLIHNTNPFFTWLLMFLHYFSVVAMAYVASFVVKSTRYTVSIALVIYTVLVVLTTFVWNETNTSLLRMPSGLLLHMPITWYWDEVDAVESYNGGITFSNFYKNHSPYGGSVLLCVLLSILQSALLLLIAWYLERVRPGAYGIVLPWDFCFQKEYWTGGKKISPEELEEESIAHDAQYYEQPPKDAEVGIKIVNVTKVFPKHVALNNVSFEVYKGEITILLGHNGAGKTTLMSIITGMMSATSGQVYVNGLDVSRQQADVRRQMGMCPQHNLFFSDLTLREHVMFFTMLKGIPYKEAKQSSISLLEQLGLKNKADSRSGDLSGGMKRRLQLACALAGGSSVLILDEPTSGLDVETRRELWDLLLSLRGEHTVLLTTHFMEEADALGDRVAALHAGSVRCHATPMYLKRAIGTGYRLSLTTIGTPDEAGVSRAVRAHVSDATVREVTLNSVSFNLPARSSKAFPALFAHLEANRAALHIDNIGVGVSTLEDVFLKLCSDVDTVFTADDQLDYGEHTEQLIDPSMRVTGYRLYWNQFLVLFARHFRYLWSKKTSFMIVQILIPTLLIAAFTYETNSSRMRADKNSAARLDLRLYGDAPGRRALYRLQLPGLDIHTLADTYPGVHFQETGDIVELMARTSAKDKLEYNKYLVGIEVNETNAKVLYTTTVRHAAPVALNLLSNLLAAREAPCPRGDVITTYNWPLDTAWARSALSHALVEPKPAYNLLIWAVFIVLFVLSTTASSVSLVCAERAAGTRHVHVMCGTPAALHWGTTLLFHAALAAGTLLLPVAVVAVALDTDDTIDRPAALAAIMFVLFLGVLAYLALAYFVSFFFLERTAGMVLFAIVFLFGLITPMVVVSQEMFETGSKPVWVRALGALGHVMPPHVGALGAVRVTQRARLNAYCELNLRRCPTLAVPEPGFDYVNCCKLQAGPHCYFCFEDSAPGPQMLILFIQFIVYMVLVYLMQLGVLKAAVDRVYNRAMRPPPRKYNDPVVRAEQAYVEKAVELPRSQISDTMLVSDIHKRYPHVMPRRACHAVKGISFSVKKGECFGLLGVNGAGKSSTFKMLTGEECATRGTVLACGRSRRLAHQAEYLRCLSYCPQFFGLDGFLTGNQNLDLLLTMRGYPAHARPNAVRSWIELVGLEKYRNRAVSTYSGGCARRLAAGAALAAGARLTLLDEPTAGVDVTARRRVWAALRRALHAGQAVLITSHSMDEMEALCSRIAIMSGGELCALGSPAALRAAYATGHAVVIKLHSRASASSDEVDGSAATSKLDSFKAKIHDKFDCTLKDQHKTMLHYHINQHMRYSKLFTELEKLKSEYDIIEDYSVTETTLEEVFLSFAKDADTPKAQV